MGETILSRAEYVKTHGTSRAGKTDLMNHLNGKRLTQRSAIKAKCYDCNGLGESDECHIKTCSLYPYSPYRSK